MKAKRRHSSLPLNRFRASSRLPPDPWLLRALPYLPFGRVLDLACGLGRNALFLAHQGFAVTGIDTCEQRLLMLRREAHRRHLDIRVQRLDHRCPAMLAADSYDVILHFSFSPRRSFGLLHQAIHQGGLAVIRSFTHRDVANCRGSYPEHLLQPGELLEHFTGWEILLYEEGLENVGRDGLAGIVARKAW